jgi:TolA-binding protein
MMKNRFHFYPLLFLLILYTFSPADQFNTAETLLKNREFDKAAEAFLAFAQSQSDHADAPLAIYTAARTRMLVQDRPEEGKTLFQDLLEDYPDTEWAFYGALRLGEYFLEQGDSLQTAASYEKAVRIGDEIFPPVSDANDAQFMALKTCGELFFALRQYRQAEPYFSRLLETEVDDRRAMPEIYARIASCHEGEGRGSKAAETYLQLIQRYPTSRQACGLCQSKDKIDPYATFDWAPYDYFVEGYTVFRTWPSKAAEHMTNVESKGGSPDLVQTAHRLLPWVHYYSHQFQKAKQAHESYLSRYPDDTDPYVQYFPMYLDSYREEFEFKEFVTAISLLISETDTTVATTPEQEYTFLSQADGWQVVDLTPHFGFYNHLIHIDRPLDSTDVAYIRFFIKSDGGQTTNLEVDNDDPWTLWFNGSYVGEFAGNPGTAQVDLIPGWNEVLIKLIQKEGDMVATFRAVNTDNEVERDLICRAVKE